jgi:hypothetical protein
MARSPFQNEESLSKEIFQSQKNEKYYSVILEYHVSSRIAIAF